MIRSKWSELGISYCFVDDTALEADTEEKLCRRVSEFVKVYERRKQQANVGKIKVLRFSMNDLASGAGVLLN